jgi:hypothetical protein
MGKNSNTKGQVVAIAEQLAAGATKHFSSTTPVAFGGSSYTLSQVTSNLQKLVDLRSSVNAAKAAATEALSVEAAQAPALVAFERQLRAFVKATYSHSPATLADFGITSKSRTALTVGAKTAAVAKSAATRAARHTMGSKQKLEVKGDVTGVVVTPVKASAPVVPTQNGPTAPATSGSPAASSSPTAPATSGGSTATTTQHAS